VRIEKERKRFFFKKRWDAHLGRKKPLLPGWKFDRHAEHVGLLRGWGGPPPRNDVATPEARRSKSFFASFFSKKEALP